MCANPTQRTILTIIFRPLNRTAAADGQIYFHLKCPSLHLSAAFFSSTKRDINHEMSDPFGQYIPNRSGMSLTMGSVSYTCYYYRDMSS